MSDRESLPATASGRVDIFDSGLQVTERFREAIRRLLKRDEGRDSAAVDPSPTLWAALTDQFEAAESADLRVDAVCSNQLPRLVFHIRIEHAADHPLPKLLAALCRFFCSN